MSHWTVRCTSVEEAIGQAAWGLGDTELSSAKSEGCDCYKKLSINELNYKVPEKYHAAEQWRTEGGFGVFKPPPPPEIPKISVDSSIAQARRTSISISFYSSLCSHTVVIY